MKPFFDSSALLQFPEQLKQRFDDDGYVFLKQVIKPEVLVSLRHDIIDIMHRKDWLKAVTPDGMAIPGVQPYVEGEQGYFSVYDELQKLESFHVLAHHPSLKPVLSALLGASAFPHPLGIARLVFPANDAWATPPHQDYPNNQGTEDLYACWIPLHRCPHELGRLNILQGSHKFGVLPLRPALGAGHRKASLEGLSKGLQWLGSDFELGDILIFHSLTVHCSAPNKTDTMRLSVDFRYQRENEALTENSLHPHFKRLSWEEIYQDWKSRELCYYWEKKKFHYGQWRDDLHDIPEDSVSDAIHERIIYDRRRERLRQVENK